MIEETLPARGPWGTTVQPWIRRWQQRWIDAPQKVRTRIQIAVLLASVLIAYSYSLRTLLQTAGQETPLAYISLVPAIALAIAAVKARPSKDEPPIHDRHVDYTVGLPLIVAALAINLVLPTQMSVMFWVYRIDLLSLPIFVAGAVAIIFGVRVLWRQKFAVLFLFLAWPWPYQRVLLSLLNAFTDATLWAIRKIVVALHLATPTSSIDGTVFLIKHHGTGFVLSVVSACSGVNSVVGFLLIGSAFAAVVRGPIVRKMLWLLGGMLLLWIINLGRITFIFWAGKEWGEDVAINILHPFIGLATFSAGVAIMVMLITPLGMHIGIAEAPARQPRFRAPHPVPSLFDPPPRARRPVAVPKVYLAITIALVSALVLGASNLNLRSYDLVADVSGNAKLETYVRFPVVPTGWSVEHTLTFEWAKPLFGDDSIWYRYLMRASDGGSLHTSDPVVADVIDTSDLSSSATYGVENCYTFHGYSLAGITKVSLVGGIDGEAMSYTSQHYGSWSIVYWIAPVKMGVETRYERVVLYVQNSGEGVVIPGLTQPIRTSNDVSTIAPTSVQDQGLVNNRTFLVAFAKQLINSQVHLADQLNADESKNSTTA